MKISTLIQGLSIVLFTTNACGPQVSEDIRTVEPDHDLYFVRGYSSETDPCKLTGETAFTNQFLDDAADLVSCPTGSEDGKELITTRQATVVAHTNGYTLYTIPRR